MTEKKIPRSKSTARSKIYIRNSGRGEGEIFRPESQLKHSETVVEKLHSSYRVEADVYDEGEGLHSAFKRTHVDQFLEMVEAAIHDPETKYIVSYDSARVFRNLGVGILTLQRLEYHGIEWHSFADGQLSFVKEDKRMQTQIKMMFDQEYSLKVSRDLKQVHYDTARAKGLYFAHIAPKGMSRHGSVKYETLNWQPNADFPVVLAAITAYTERWSTIAAWHAVKHLKWQDGSRVQLGIVQKIIWRIERYQSVLDPTLLQQVIAIRAERSQHRLTTTNRKHPPLLLRGLLTCGVCEQSLVTDSRFEAKGAWLYYRHREPACVPRGYRALELHDRFWEQFDSLGRLTPTQRSELEAQLIAPPSQQNTFDHTDAIRKLEAQLGGFARMRAAGEITAERFREWSVQIEAEIQGLRTPAPLPTTYRFTPDEVKLVLNTPTELLKRYALKDPAPFNNLLHFMVRITVNPNYKLKVTWLPPFDTVVAADV